MSKTNAVIGDAHMGTENDVIANPQASDLGAIEDRQQKTWTLDTHARIGNAPVVMGAFLCEAVDVRSTTRPSTSHPAAISTARGSCNATA